MVLLQTAPAATPTLRSVLNEFVTGLLNAIPRLIAGVVFLTLSYLAIKVILTISRRIFERMYPPGQRLIVDLLVTVIGVFLWFGAALALLKIVGLGDIATSLGTAAGFIGLGIAFALKEMIADTVAGVYLLQDADFNEGDLVTTASTTGTVDRIDLRKTRLRTEEDLVVLSNRDVEKKWVREDISTGDENESKSES